MALCPASAASISKAPGTTASAGPMGLLLPPKRALARLLPVALGFAYSPIPLVEMVLILFSRRALANGIVFLACIMAPVFRIPFIGATGQDAAATTPSEDRPPRESCCSSWPRCCWASPG